MTPTQAEPVDELVTVAVIGGTDVETRTLVDEVLTSIGITPLIEGSAVYGVQVKRADHARARQALETEPRLAGRWIQYVELEPPGAAPTDPARPPSP